MKEMAEVVSDDSFVAPETRPVFRRPSRHHHLVFTKDAGGIPRMQ